ncbi:MAG: cobalamin biosynthesis protein CobW [Hyphomicrobiales bacterium]|nr:cobalamin biosynthesis protein CobW [Hyphomicrobiales bacterium]
MNSLPLNPSAKIPVTIITGFLGAGKTTLIRHLLLNAAGRRLALVINEFGDVGVDGELLRHCGAATCPADNIIELANGCICCTVAEDFMPAIDALLQRQPQPEHVIIETSGLALPKPLIKAFDWPQIRARLTIDGVIAVVDAEALAAGRFVEPETMPGAPVHENPLEEVYHDQLLSADLVLLNKCDLVSEDLQGTLKAGIAALVPRPLKVLGLRDGVIAPEILLGLMAGAEDDLAARPSHHDAEEGHDHDDFDSFVAPIAAVRDREAFVATLGEIAAHHDILRMKGFVEVEGKPMRLLVQAVGGRIQHHFDRPWGAEEARTSRLVVIGQKGLSQAAILAALERP